ncbi:hypothetical protein ACI3KS_01845 [Microbacterium sp. ZW T5_45]|uniref:hypothetical protein n=1 Tax=Microbacterium sp. ZW T5_45 TaxID=3378080 RepID=UPI003852555A
MSASRDERLAAALAIKKLDGFTEQIVTVVEDVDGVPIHVDEIYQQTVVFLPEAFGVTEADIEAAELIESAAEQESE